MGAVKRIIAYISQWFKGKTFPFTPGEWLNGSHSSWQGRLLFAFWLSPRRQYYLYFPKTYQPGQRLPLLVMLHGCKQDSQIFAAGTRMNSLADQQSFAVLYPQQEQKFNGYRCWNWFDWASQIGYGEAVIIAKMVKKIRRRYPIDAQRTYVAGLSAGAAMTSILAARHGRLFRAVGVHSGLPAGAAYSPYVAMRAMKKGAQAGLWFSLPRPVTQQTMAIPGMVIHGEQDEVVQRINTEQLIVQFAGLNAKPTSNRSEVSASGLNYELADYHQGQQLQLRTCLVQGLGHAWSGGNDAYDYNDPRGPDANRLLWEFFNQV